MYKKLVVVFFAVAIIMVCSGSVINEQETQEAAENYQSPYFYGNRGFGSYHGYRPSYYSGYRPSFYGGHRYPQFGTNNLYSGYRPTLGAYWG